MRPPTDLEISLLTEIYYGGDPLRRASGQERGTRLRALRNARHKGLCRWIDYDRGWKLTEQGRMLFATPEELAAKRDAKLRELREQREKTSKELARLDDAICMLGAVEPARVGKALRALEAAS
jgi:hypothetical protein